MTSRLEPVVPPYRQIANAVREKITGGEYGAGDKLPGIRPMSEVWGTAATTIHKAYALLQQEGLVRITPQGTLVCTEEDRRLDPLGIVRDLAVCDWTWDDEGLCVACRGPERTGAHTRDCVLWRAVDAVVEGRA
jgi:DNA-binding transcriptional MocR family regulator